MVRLPYTILVSLFVLSGQPQRALAGCSLKATSYPPVVTTEFGSKLLLSESSETYEREDGEEINLFCGSGLDMNFITQYNSAGPQIMLKCLSSYFDINGDTARNLEVSCKGRVSQMFESKTSLPKCSNYMTLVLAYNFQDKGTIKNAAMCYDILEAQLKYISYTSFSTRKRIIEENQAGQLNNLGLDISVAYRKNLVKNFSQDDIDTYLKKERHLSELFGNGVFEYKNLLQDESAGKSLIGYDDMFNIIWLKNLRTGSWKLWLNALRAATEAGTQFDIRLGVSGTLNLPRTSMNPCMNYTEHLVIEPKAPGSSSVRVPAYIWAHVHTLKPMGHAGGQDEFVIIGHNSPFSVNATEVCSSMCHQVSWLKDTLFARLREYPAYGLVQCCHVKDVAHKLDNFPGAFVTETASPTAASTTS
ncbi:hypothetical protein KR074_000794, partial [Drosophila pseudoananassae]